ncbi:MAG: hypothetical protein AAF731_04820 [Bacteroidota bacterium]
MQRLLILIVSLTLCSCSIFQDKNLAKRYRNRKNLGTFRNSTEPQLFVQVDLNSSLISTPKKENVKYNVLSLSDKGQEAYINSINSKSVKSDELIKLINTNFNFLNSKKSRTKIISNTVKKTLIFTVDRLHSYKINDEKDTRTVFNNLGDRISYLELGLKLSNENKATFNSWDKYVTDKITLNLGKVSSAQNWNASISASAKGSGTVSLTGSNSREENISTTESSSILLNTGNDNTNTTSYELASGNNNTGSRANSFSSSGELGGSATIGFTDTYQTSLDLNSEILKLSGTLAEKNMLLRQEGGPGIDLSGNIVVSVEYKLKDNWAPPIKFSKPGKLYDKSGKPKQPSIIESSFLLVIYPDIKEDIKGELEYKFLYRQVNKGNRHLPEARHKVTYYHGDVQSNENSLFKDNDGLVNLVSVEDIRPKGYIIQSKNTGKLQLNNEELKFESISEAANFLVYLNDLVLHKTTLSGFSLDGKILSTDDISKLQILTIQF